MSETLARWNEAIRRRLTEFEPRWDGKTPYDFNRDIRRVSVEVEHFGDQTGIYLYSEVYKRHNDEIVEAWRGEWDRKRRDLRGGGHPLDLRAITKRSQP